MKRYIFTLITLILVNNYSFSQSQIMFTAKLDGSQQVPAVTTIASGTGTFVLNSNGTQLTYNVTVNGLSGPITGSHFHNGAAGVSAGVVKSVTFSGNTVTGVWSSTDANQPLTDLLLSELLRGRLYFNVHTSANPGGEIRGQVLLSSGVGFTAKLEGSQSNPAVTTTASGTGSVRLNTDGTVTYDITAADLIPTAAHFHNAPAGTNGGVVKTITLTNNTGLGIWASIDVTQPFTDLLLRELVKGNLYMNVHTTANPGGEIRGQVLASTNDLATSVKHVDDASIPENFILTQNYPNPFNPTTTIRFTIPETSFLTLKVFDILGREVALLVNEMKDVGNYAVQFDAAKLSSGIYFYRLQAGNFLQTRKMILIK